MRRRCRDAARNVLAGLRQELREGRFGQSVSKVTPFNELVELLHTDYLRRELWPWDRAERAIAHLRPVFGSLPAASITFARIGSYIIRRAQEGAQPGTTNAEVAALRRV